VHQPVVPELRLRVDALAIKTREDGR
jgi:hypothetical protein